MPSGNPNIKKAGEKTRWKPGQTGNPSGPKPGYKHINTWVQEMLEDPDFEAWVSDPKEGIKKFEGAPIKAIIKAQIIKAVNGDTKAYDSLHKSGYSQKIEQENSGEQTITVITRHAGSKDDSEQPDN